MKLIDLSHTFNENMPVYPGDPLPEFKESANLENQGYNEYTIKTGMHVGTHIDAPSHMIKNGTRISDLELEKFIGRGVLIDAQDKKLDEKLLENSHLMKGDVLLIMTGFYKKFGQNEYYEKYPQITEGFAKKCVEIGIKILALDTPSPDRAPYKIHKILLESGTLIIENITNLEALSKYKNFEIMAFPPKFKTEASVVRVIAKITD